MITLTMMLQCDNNLVMLQYRLTCGICQQERFVDLLLDAVEAAPAGGVVEDVAYLLILGILLLLD